MRVFLAVLLCQVFFLWPVDLGVSLRSLALGVSIVERGSFALDPEIRLGDKVEAQGRVFALTAPGQGLCLAPGLAALRLLGIEDLYGVTARIFAALLIGALCNALAAAAIYRLVADCKSAPVDAAGMLCAASLCLASFALPLSTAAYDQPPTLCLFAFALVLLLKRPEQDRRAAFLAGLCAGLAVLFNYLSVFPALALFVYVLKLKEQKLAFVLGAGLMAGVLAYYNWSCFGAPWRTAYGFLSAKQMGGAFTRGVMGFQLPTLESLTMLLFSTERGLLFHAPILLLAPYGLWRAWQAERLPRPQVVLLLSCASLVFLANAARLSDLNGGPSAGPRYLLTLLVFTAPFVAIAVREVRPWIVLCAIVPGLALALAECLGPWYLLPQYTLAEVLRSGPRLRLALQLGASSGLAAKLAIGVLAVLPLLVNELIGRREWRRWLFVLGLVPALVWLPGLSERVSAEGNVRRRLRSEQAILLSLRSPSAALIVAQGNVLLEFREEVAALMAYRRAVRIEPALARAWLGILRSSGEPGERQEAAERARSLEPELTAAVLLHWARLGELDRARALVPSLPPEQQEPAIRMLDGLSRPSRH